MRIKSSSSKVGLFLTTRINVDDFTLDRFTWIGMSKDIICRDEESVNEQKNGVNYQPYWIKQYYIYYIYFL